MAFRLRVTLALPSEEGVGVGAAAVGESRKVSSIEVEGRCPSRLLRDEEQENRETGKSRERGRERERAGGEYQVALALELMLAVAAGLILVRSNKAKLLENGCVALRTFRPSAGVSAAP